MGPFEIITIVVVGLAVLAILARFIYKKVRGESLGCDCGDCSACGHCNACRDRERRKNSKSE